MVNIIGKPLNRVDGSLKVTGRAQYSAEFPQENLAYAVGIPSTIARGKIKSIDTSAAESLPGVIKVITHENAPKLQPLKTFMQGGTAAESYLPFQDNSVYYSGEHIGLVIADSLEQATYAASLVQFTYEEETPIVEMQKQRNEEFEPQTVFGKKPSVIRGNPQDAFNKADIKVDEIYTTPTENHNPIEPSATIAVWDNDTLTVYSSTQATYGTRKALADSLEIPEENIRVICQFIGGAFGCKGTFWSHMLLPVIASRQVNRPVKLVLTREDMYNVVGHRAETEQNVKLGATREGKLTAIIHDGITNTSMYDEFVEPFTVATHMMYACDNLQASQRLVRLNRVTPTFMRAPGEAPGIFAIESAMDELAYALKIDPIELRLINHADTDPDENLPWSSKSLKECYQIGAEKFGWSKRNPEIGSMRDGRYLIGMGMATATYPAFSSPASAKAKMLSDGSVVVQSSTHEMGGGTATVMAQLIADTLGFPFEKVCFEYGDTKLPRAPVSGGSMTISSVGSAVHGAVKGLQAKILELGGIKQSDSLTIEDYANILKKNNREQIEIEYDAKFSQEKEYSKHAFGAQFVEVRIDPDFGEVRINRYTGAFACGKILNHKTARSQFMGGIIMGIGMALMEESVVDPNLGRVMNANLGEYHVPVNADIPDIDIEMVEEIDNHVNPIGTKGIGEIGITGVAAAVANAVYHATGKRVRNLPITPDKVM
ncbi:aldehyde oxidase and xanthine dehydrogenase, molybdopterin binding protein [Calothrix parasitica NIES-267]|uniref:Aldehyde oxidase and xanthine dehydrogenase, molybdopterin binding protein n=1 Tax=Calothrix parasitica NIES-267 TaxID=1973488 RepID=A0A1Z4LH57_9CYAN|nr:aldehyde oxidase and xanthine dehydrogenase, molybdopterin binding protein [Calothrix parasitica NIES-267]